MTYHQLDARRLLCPLPVIRVQERVKQLKKGDILEIVCTDRGSLSDISAWCRIHGHYLLSSHAEQREIFMTLQIGQTSDLSQNNRNLLELETND
ncbi:MAG: sulfurtransferase TusA family protein [Rickettsiella sp.]|nr:sulfurtransferase TusA family protein [Rickettsiella sp.]